MIDIETDGTLFEISGIVPFVAIPLFQAPAGGSNPVGTIAYPCRAII